MIASAMCFVIGLLDEQPVLAALAAVIASVNFPILCAGATVGLGIAILWRERSLLWLLACTVVSGLIQVMLGAGGFRATLAATLMISGTIAFLIRDRWKIGSPDAIRAGAAGVGLAFLSFLLLWCAGQRATFVWIELPRDPVTAEEKSWKDAEQWARLNSPKEAVFLVPPDRQGFQLGSERNVWVDWRQGAAVMWSPSFYARWWARFPEVARLKTHSDFSAYAAAHRIDYYVVERKQDTRNPPPEAPVYSNAAFDIYRLKSGGH
jgi:hypothetical protein